MVVSGKGVDTFQEANIADLRDKKVDGEWAGRVSLNNDWEHFHSTMEDLEEDRVKLRNIGWNEIKEDEVGEYVLVEQEEQGMFTEDKLYKTKMRPFRDEKTGLKPWMKETFEVSMEVSGPEDLTAEEVWHFFEQVEHQLDFEFREFDVEEIDMDTVRKKGEEDE